MNKILISETANPLLVSWLKGSGLDIHRVPCHNGSLIGTHPDLYHCQMSLFAYKTDPSDNLSPDETFAYKTDLHSTVYYGDVTKVGSIYPTDCIYNAASTGRFFIHNTNITAPSLLDTAKDRKMEIIHVKQGYAKCNCVIVDENSIITSDAGIAKACLNKLDCLLIRQGHVILEGFRYGFLGGTSGRIGNTIIFNGDVSIHPDWQQIKKFITARNLDIKYFDSYPLTDIGSIIYDFR